MNNKHIIFLQGGLGNQMFQYAFYLSLKNKFENVYCNSSLISINPQHNGVELEKIFGINDICKSFNRFNLKLIDKLLINNSFSQRYLLKSLNYINIKINIDNIPSVYIPFENSSYNSSLYIGYWQTELYFDQIKSSIIDTFRFNENAISTQTKYILNKIEETNSVSIHVRRGDYLSSKNYSVYCGICNDDYYIRAIKKANELIKNITFFVFSDDMEWVKNNLGLSNCEYVECNVGINSWQDMFLMSKCKHNIIANSSFSWWGAWLNQNPYKKVLSPSRFLNTDNRSDIIPQDWITI